MSAPLGGGHMRSAPLGGHIMSSTPSPVRLGRHPPGQNIYFILYKERKRRHKEGPKEKQRRSKRPKNQRGQKERDRWREEKNVIESLFNYCDKRDKSKLSFDFNLKYNKDNNPK